MRTIIIALVAALATGPAWAAEGVNSFSPYLSSLPSGDYCVNSAIIMSYKGECEKSTVHVKISEEPSQDRSWHLLTQSYGGTVSLLRDLTKQECEFSYHRLLGMPATPAEEEVQRKRFAECKNTKGQSLGCAGENAIVSHSGSYSPGNIRSAECFQ